MRLPTPFFDVFACLMGIFMLFNVMTAAYFNESPEKTLPPMDLASAKGGSTPGLTWVESLNISIRPGEDGHTLHYFLDNRETTLEGLPERLAELSPKEVVLRVDKGIPHGEVIKLMVICERQGVGNISFAYKDLK
ncbi:MAG TPA: hypothetical protein EYP21_02380 [Syntrophaceae bacterium]|nr:hypothetical protein [Syntrophaceae bacterium]